MQEESKDEADVEEYIRRIKLYGNCPELTREMCLQLIEFITIDAKTEHNNRWHPPAPRNIHIYYKLIDKEHANPSENNRTFLFVHNIKSAASTSKSSCFGTDILRIKTWLPPPWTEAIPITPESSFRKKP